MLEGGWRMEIGQKEGGLKVKERKDTKCADGDRPGLGRG